MSDRKLDSLQILRGIAATGVVIHHSLRAASVNHPAYVTLPPGTVMPNPTLMNLGAAGVDIFFILSGFLMIHISGPYFAGKRSAGHFLAQRLIRIWPLYALITSYLVLYPVPAMLRTGIVPFDLHPLRLASYAFIPSFDEHGVLQPILGVGWTLNYEMLFYLCFAAILMFGRRHALVRLAGILAALFVAGRLLHGTALGDFLGNSIVLEFLFGATVAATMQSGRFKPSHGLYWLLAGIVTLPLSTLVDTYDLARPFLAGLPALALFVGFLALEGKVRFPAWLRLLGDASYSIYLIHIIIVYRVVGGAMKLAIGHGLGHYATLFAAAFCVAAAIGMGLACFMLIERPLLRLCQRTYNRFFTPAKPEAPPLVAQ